MRKSTYRFMLSTIACLALSLGSTASADIIWSAAGIGGLGDSSVSTLGTLEYAYSGAGAAVIVNTVPFAGTATGGVADYAGEGNVTVVNPDNGANAGFSNQSGNLDILLDSGHWAHRNPNGTGLPGSGGTGVRTTISLNNLAIGQDYLVQVFSSDTRGTRNSFVAIDRDLPTAFISTVGNGSVASGGGDGVVLTGLFEATAGTESFTYIHDGLGGNANYNAIQLRSVPEPGGATLLVGGLLSVFGSRRRRK